MSSRTGARAAHTMAFALAAFAVVFQLVLVVQGHSPLAPELRPSTGETVRRFFSSFTIQSNNAGGRHDPGARPRAGRT